MWRQRKASKTGQGVISFIWQLSTVLPPHTEIQLGKKDNKIIQKKKNAEHMRRVINANALRVAQEGIKMVVKGNLVCSSFLP